MMLFYERLAGKIVIYDPLNRPILDDDDCDMGTNRDQFMMEINQMEQLNAGDLDTMMSPENQDILEELFDKKEKEVKNICDDLLKDVKDQGEASKTNVLIKDDPIVIGHIKILEFFANEKLLSDA